MLYLVIALYDDNEQRYAMEVEAKSFKEAERLAQETAYIDNHEPEEPLIIDPDDYELVIAGVVAVEKDRYEVVA